jgi:hypothetical protein
MDFIDLIITLGFEEHQVKNPLMAKHESVNQVISKLNLNSYYKFSEL